MKKYLVYGISTFAFSMIITFISLGYHFYESYQLKQFREKFFFRGKLKINILESTNIDNFKFETNKIYETNKGRFKCLNNKKCLFKVKAEYLNNLLLSEVLKGVIKLENNKLRNYRQNIFSTIYHTAFCNFRMYCYRIDGIFSK